jgi:hypothetical protein
MWMSRGTLIWSTLVPQLFWSPAFHCPPPLSLSWGLCQPIPENLYLFPLSLMLLGSDLDFLGPEQLVLGDAFQAVAGSIGHSFLPAPSCLCPHLWLATCNGILPFGHFRGPGLPEFP